MNTIYNFGDPVLYAGHHAIVLASYTSNEYEVAFTDKIGDGPGYWKTAIAKREELQAHRATMTPDTTIEQQARREAEERYPDDLDPAKGQWMYRDITGTEKCYTSATCLMKRQVCMETLIAERSKPQPSVDQIMSCIDNYFGDSRFEVPWDILDRGELRDRLTTLLNK
jgi:hypothetical protein